MPSPNVIVVPSLNTDRERAAARLVQAQILGRGVERIAGIAGHAFETYALMKDKEDTQKLSLLHDIISTYGSEAGQPAFKEYDQILQRKGIGGLPKDPVTGDILPPPKTTDQLVNDAIRQDPEAIAAMAQKKSQGVSPLEAALKKHEADAKAKADAEKERHNRAIEQSSMLRAQRTGLKSYASGQPSPYVMNQDTSEIQTLAPDVPPPVGFTRLNAGQIDRIFHQQELANKTELNDVSVKLKQAQLDAKGMEIVTDVITGPGSVFLNYFKNYDKLPKDAKKQMDPAIRRFWADHGVNPDSEEPNFFIRKFQEFKAALGASTFGEIEKHVQERQGPAPSELPNPLPPGGPNTIKLKSGAVVREEAIP